jgi:hypothetical protein
VGGGIHRLLAAAGDVDGVALRFENAPQAGRERSIVFNDQ